MSEGRATLVNLCNSTTSVQETRELRAGCQYEFYLPPTYSLCYYAMQGARITVAVQLRSSSLMRHNNETGRYITAKEKKEIYEK